MNKEKRQTQVTTNNRVKIITRVFLGVALVSAFFGVFYSLVSRYFFEKEIALIDDFAYSCASIDFDNFYGVGGDAEKTKALQIYSRSDCGQDFQTISGRLNILAFDNFDTGIDFDQYYLETDNGDVELAFANAPHSIFKAGMELEVAGYYVADQELLLIDAAKDLSAESDPDIKTGYQVTDSVKDRVDAVGEKKVLMLMTYFNGENVPTKPSEQIVRGSMYLTDLYYQQNSLGQLDFSGVTEPDQPADVIDWTEIEMERPTCEEIYPGGASTDIYESVIASLADELDFTQYDGQNLMIVSDFDCTSTWLGMGWMSPRNVTLSDGQQIELSITMIDTSNFPLSFFYDTPTLDMDINNGRRTQQDKIVMVLSHELGHNLGHDHASYIPCDLSVTPLYQCAIEEYHDGYDVMGNWGPYHFNAKHKTESGWLTATSGNLAEVVDSGTYSIYPLQYEQDNRIQALKIPRLDGESLWVEYRGVVDKQSFDYEMPSWGGSGGIYQGAVLHVDDPILNRSLLLIPGGEGSDPNNATHPSFPCLNPGESFTDPLTGTQVTVLEMNSDTVIPKDSYIVVQITMGEAEQCEGGLSPRECTQVGDGQMCYAGGLFEADCRACGCESGLTCGESASGDYQCCESVNEDGECIPCRNNMDCNDYNICTNDSCINPDTSISECSHDTIANTCGNQECGLSGDGCFQCGTCQTGEYCVNNSCTSYTCEEKNGTCAFNCESLENDLSGDSDFTYAPYYCPVGKCCIPASLNIE